MGLLPCMKLEEVTGSSMRYLVEIKDAEVARTTAKKRKNSDATPSMRLVVSIVESSALEGTLRGLFRHLLPVRSRN